MDLGQGDEGGVRDIFKVRWDYLSLYLSASDCQDPCRNHKSYREVISKMKPPVIPFVPLILKGESLPCPSSHILRAPVPALNPWHSALGARLDRSPPLSGCGGGGGEGPLRPPLFFFPWASFPSPRPDFPARGE